MLQLMASLNMTQTCSSCWNVFISFEELPRRTRHSLVTVWTGTPAWHWCPMNKFRLRQNGRHLTDDLFKCIFLNENVWISIKVSLHFVPQGPIDDIPALVQIMAWRRPGDKPLSEPMMVRLPTYICVTRPHFINFNNHFCLVSTALEYNVATYC